MTTELTPNEVGAIAAVMGIRRDRVEAEQLAGYDAKVQAMAQAQAEQAAEMAEYNRLAATGMSDAEIQKAMGK